MLQTLTDVDARLQKSKNNMSGTEFAKAKEAAADIMRQKQAAGTTAPCPSRCFPAFIGSIVCARH